MQGLFFIIGISQRMVWLKSTSDRIQQTEQDPHRIFNFLNMLYTYTIAICLVWMMIAFIVAITSYLAAFIVTLAVRGSLVPICNRSSSVSRVQWNQHAVLWSLSGVVVLWVCNVIIWLIYPYPLGLFHWHWAIVCITGKMKYYITTRKHYKKQTACMVHGLYDIRHLDVMLPFTRQWTKWRQDVTVKCNHIVICRLP